nr:FAD:protein FMN transferase [Bacteroidales bacterium]
MKFRTILFSVALTILALTSCEEKSKYVVISGYAQGGIYSVKANLDGVKISPEELKAGLDSLVNTIEFSVSGFNKESILSKYNNGEDVEFDDHFTRLVEAGKKYYAETEGAVDMG